MASMTTLSEETQSNVILRSIPCISSDSEQLTMKSGGNLTQVNQSQLGAKTTEVELISPSVIEDCISPDDGTSDDNQPSNLSSVSSNFFSLESLSDHQEMFSAASSIISEFEEPSLKDLSSVPLSLPLEIDDLCVKHEGAGDPLKSHLKPTEHSIINLCSTEFAKTKFPVLEDAAVKQVDPCTEEIQFSVLEDGSGELGDISKQMCPDESQKFPLPSNSEASKEFPAAVGSADHVSRLEILSTKSSSSSYTKNEAPSVESLLVDEFSSSSNRRNQASSAGTSIEESIFSPSMRNQDKQKDHLPSSCSGNETAKLENSPTEESLRRSYTKNQEQLEESLASSCSRNEATLPESSLVKSSSSSCSENEGNSEISLKEDAPLCTDHSNQSGDDSTSHQSSASTSTPLSKSKILVSNNKNTTTTNSSIIRRSSSKSSSSSSRHASGMNFSFAGCGFLGIYHVGVASCLRKFAPDLKIEFIAGASAGAMAAACLLSDANLGAIKSCILESAREARSRVMGGFSPTYDIQKELRDGLNMALPADVHERLSGRLFVSVTRISDGENVILSQFRSRDELLQVLMCSSFIPLFSGLFPLKVRGVRYMDGGFSDNLPITDAATVTASPFSGEADICPRDISSGLLTFSVTNTNFQISRRNIQRFVHALFPPHPDELKKVCQQGFNDCLDFLVRNKFTSCRRCTSLISSVTTTSTANHPKESDRLGLEGKSGAVVLCQGGTTGDDVAKSTRTTRAKNNSAHDISFGEDARCTSSNSAKNDTNLDISREDDRRTISTNQQNDHNSKSISDEDTRGTITTSKNENNKGEFLNEDNKNTTIKTNNNSENIASDDTRCRITTKDDDKCNTEENGKGSNVVERSVARTLSLGLKKDFDDCETWREKCINCPHCREQMQESVMTAVLDPSQYELTEACKISVIPRPLHQRALSAVSYLTIPITFSAKLPFMVVGGVVSRLPLVPSVLGLQAFTLQAVKLAKRMLTWRRSDPSNYSGQPTGQQSNAADLPGGSSCSSSRHLLQRQRKQTVYEDQGSIETLNEGGDLDRTVTCWTRSTTDAMDRNKDHQLEESLANQYAARVTRHPTYGSDDVPSSGPCVFICVSVHGEGSSPVLWDTRVIPRLNPPSPQQIQRNLLAIPNR